MEELRKRFTLARSTKLRTALDAARRLKIRSTEIFERLERAGTVPEKSELMEHAGNAEAAITGLTAHDYAARMIEDALEEAAAAPAAPPPADTSGTGKPQEKTGETVATKLGKPAEEEDPEGAAEAGAGEDPPADPKKEGDGEEPPKDPEKEGGSPEPPNKGPKKSEPKKGSGGKGTTKK